LEVEILFNNYDFDSPPKCGIPLIINKFEMAYHSILVCRHMSGGNLSVNLRPHFRHIASRLAAKWAVVSARTKNGKAQEAWPK